MYILVEEPGINSVQDVFKWQNPRLKNYNLTKYMHENGKWLHKTLAKQPPTSGQTLAKAMLTCSAKYGVEWVFCNKNETASKIVELLTKGKDNGNGNS